MYKHRNIRRRRAFGRFAGKVPNIKASVLQNVDQTRARYPLLPTNYGRGRGGGRVIQQRDDGKSAAAIAAFGGNLTTAQRQIENQKEAIETLGRRVRVGEMRAGRDSRVISAFAFTNRQREIIDQIRDDETSATARNRLIRELSKDVDNRFKPTDLKPDGGGPGRRLSDIDTGVESESDTEMKEAPPLRRPSPRLPKEVEMRDAPPLPSRRPPPPPLPKEVDMSDRPPPPRTRSLRPSEIQADEPEVQTTETQTDAPVAQANETQTDNPVSQANETQTDNPVSQANETQTDAPVAQANETQTEFPETSAASTETQVNDAPPAEPQPTIPDFMTAASPPVDFTNFTVEKPELEGIPLPTSDKTRKPAVKFTAPGTTPTTPDAPTPKVKFTGEGGEARPKKSKTSIVGGDPVSFTEAPAPVGGFQPLRSDARTAYRIGESTAQPFFKPLPIDVSMAAGGEDGKLQRTAGMSRPPRRIQNENEGRKREPVRPYTDEQLRQIRDARNAPGGQVRRLIGMFEGEGPMED